VQTHSFVYACLTPGSTSTYPIYLCTKVNRLSCTTFFLWFLHFVLQYTVGSLFATVRFTTIHFYDPCPVGPSTPDLWRITVATQASFLYLARFQLFAGVHELFLLQCSSFKLEFFHPWCPSKRHKIRKNQKVDVTFFLYVVCTTAWAFFNKIKSD